MNRALAMAGAVALAAMPTLAADMASQKWVEMRMAELEARIRADIGSVTVSTNNPVEFTNTVAVAVSGMVADSSGTIGEILSTQFAESVLAVSGTTQYVVVVASPLLCAEYPAVTNALPVNAVLSPSNQYFVAENAILDKTLGPNMDRLTVTVGASEYIFGWDYDTQSFVLAGHDGVSYVLGEVK